MFRAALAALTLAAALTGCGGATGATVDRLASGPPSATAAAAGSDTATPITPASAVPTDGIQGAVGRQVLRLYQAWWDAQVTAFAKPGKGSGTEISVLSTGQALSDALANLHRLQEAGMVMQGRPGNSPTVTALDLTSTPQTATIQDCLDVSGWHQVDAHSKQNRDPRQRLSRYPVTASARSSGATWLITRFKAETGKTC